MNFQIEKIIPSLEFRHKLQGYRHFHRFLYLKWMGLNIQKHAVVQKHVKWPLTRLKQIFIGKNSVIGEDSHFFIPIKNNDARIIIGDKTFIGKKTTICCLGKISIGDECLFSDGIMISDSEHVFGKNISPVTSGLEHQGDIFIGNKCFIGRNVMITPGISLGDNCVVGANSVVTHSFAACSVIGGCPAKLIKKLI